jgi:O-antigen/teichoic acid export membrane protein
LTTKKDFFTTSIFLFLDNIIVAAAGWLFWIIVGKFSSTSDIGISTYLITIASFVSGILLLGFEFSLLKKVGSMQIDKSSLRENWVRSSTFGLILTFEVFVNILCIPLLILIIQTPSTDPAVPYIVSLLLLTTSIGNMSRYGLIGFMQTKTVFFVDTASILLRIVVALLLMSNRSGEYAILIATLAQTTMLAVCFGTIFLLKHGISLGNKRLLVAILREGISNFPGKISKLMIAPLSVILLGIVGMGTSDIGIFFISLIITIVAASFATSLAMVSLSTSSGGVDTADTSLRLGIALTIPLIIILALFPEYVLGLIGSSYVPGSLNLIILSIAIFPSVIVLNVISRLNSLRDNRNLVFIGLIEISIFLISFFWLTPSLDTLGASIAILVSYLISAGVACKWLTRNELKQLFRSVILMALGLTLGGLVTTLQLQVELQIAITTALVILLGYILRIMTLGEIKTIVSSIIRT